jgi:hypothetical protein
VPVQLLFGLAADDRIMGHPDSSWERTMFPFRIVAATAISMIVLAAPGLEFGAARAALTPAPPESISVEQCDSLARLVAPSVRAAAEDRLAAEYDSVATSHNTRPAYWFGVDALIAPPGYYDPAIFVESTCKNVHGDSSTNSTAATGLPTPPSSAARPVIQAIRPTLHAA